MTRFAKLFIMFLLMSISSVTFAQPLFAQTDEVEWTEMREKIGLNLSVPDFNTKKNDSKIMGSRLAGILEYLLDNYQHGVYNRRMSAVVSEQNDTLENIYVQIKKLNFVNAVKKVKEITILMRADLQKNAANVKQTDIVFHFVDGVSESYGVNELFSNVSHYIQIREQLK